MSTHGENSREFKFKIMELHFKDNISVKVLSEKFAIPEQTIYTWRREYRKYGEDAL
ncbi:helix-turn-helix domain-containing protein [Ruminococcus sp. NK3A76]|uniref:helix-turn-helix domain-containing protein n=1 Tax=Ruminococcus sp. NK3A76 TaxID=877411 RepID=UPI000A06EA0C|nr:helix-turn-helix domain-containing protein [Ruminococcus sp. NK3A76]